MHLSNRNTPAGHAASGRPRAIALVRLRLTPLLIAVLSLLAGPSLSWAQTSYWVGRIQDKVYVFDVPVPAAFAEAALRLDEHQYEIDKAPRELPPQTVNGTRYAFVLAAFTYDAPMLGRGQIAAQRRPGTTAMQWLDIQPGSDAGQRFSTQLPQPVGGSWNTVDLVLLTAPQAPPPGFSVPVPPLKLAASRMRQLATQTRAGTHFPGVQVPADLEAYRREMLAYGNAGRRDPDFRKVWGSATATDLRADTVSVYADASKRSRRNEPVRRENATAPYFSDHQLDAQLNQAAQFHAEYTASIDQGTHFGPRRYAVPGTGQVVDMYDPSQRVRHFGFTRAVVEGVALNSPGGSPHSWMQGDTHFRPFFNVAGCYPAIGYGAARAASGRWYFVMVPEIDHRPDCATAARPADPGAAMAAAPAPERASLPPPPPSVQPSAPPSRPPAAAATPVAPAASPLATVPVSADFPLRTGTVLEQGRRYRSASGAHVLVFQRDGNLVVNDAAGRYVWGLDRLPNFQQIRTVELQRDGNLVAYGEKRTYIWSALTRNPDPSAHLHLTPGGELQLVSGRGGAVLWSSSNR